MSFCICVGKITDDDVIRKDGGRREMRWEDGDEKSLLVSGMMRKGLFNFIIATNGACYFVCVGKNNR